MAFPTNAVAVKFGEFPWVGEYADVEGKVDEAHLASLTLAYEQWMDSLISMGQVVMKFDDRLGLLYELVSRAHLRVGIVRQLMRSRATARNPARMYAASLRIAEARLGFVSDFDAIGAAGVVRGLLLSMYGGVEKLAELIAEQTPVLPTGFDVGHVDVPSVSVSESDDSHVGLGITQLEVVADVTLAQPSVGDQLTVSPRGDADPTTDVSVSVDRYGYTVPSVTVVSVREGEFDKPSVPFATVGPVAVLDVDGESHQKYVRLFQTGWQVANVELVDPYDVNGKRACHAVTMLEAVNSIMTNRIHVQQFHGNTDSVNLMVGTFGSIRFQVCWADDVDRAVASLGTGQVSLTPGHMAIYGVAPLASSGGNPRVSYAVSAGEVVDGGFSKDGFLGSSDVGTFAQHRVVGVGVLESIRERVGSVDADTILQAVDRHHRDGSDVLASVWDAVPGYCYLAAVLPASRGRVANQLGPWPKLRQLLSLPLACVDVTLLATSIRFVVVGEQILHVYEEDRRLGTNRDSMVLNHFRYDDIAGLARAAGDGSLAAWFVTTSGVGSIGRLTSGGDHLGLVYDLDFRVGSRDVARFCDNGHFIDDPGDASQSDGLQDSSDLFPSLRFRGNTFSYDEEGFRVTVASLGAAQGSYIDVPVVSSGTHVWLFEHGAVDMRSSSVLSNCLVRRSGRYVEPLALPVLKYTSYMHVTIEGDCDATPYLWRALTHAGFMHATAADDYMEFAEERGLDFAVSMSTDYPVSTLAHTFRAFTDTTRMYAQTRV